MANLFLALILISILILIIAASVEVRITYADSLRVSFDFLFFSLVFYDDKKKRRKKNRDIFERLKIGVKRTRASISALEFILKNSSVTVHSVNIPLREREPSELVTARGNISSLILVIFAYLSLKAERISLEDDNFFSNSDYQSLLPTLDLTMKTTVYIILSAVIIYFLKINSKTERSVKNNVGNENE